MEQLELENQEMEERLRNFRESMAREKAKRRFLNEINWFHALIYSLAFQVER